MNGGTALADVTALPEMIGLATDPRVLANRLAALRPGQLLACASRTAETARALAAGSATGRPAVGELIRGWSAPEPPERVSRLLWTAEQTAAMLSGQSAAIVGACTIIERAIAGGQLDMALAVAELDALRRNPPSGVLGAILGVGQVTGALEMRGIVARLCDALTARIHAVDLAVASLESMLGGDPTAAPDNLRAGPNAVLPPDPVMNPAHRTDQRNRAALAADLRSNDPARMKFAMAMLASLQQAGDRSGTAQLLVYDSTAFNGQGRAAVSVGDLTSATNVAVVVPGISNSPSSMTSGLDLAADLRDEAIRQDPGEQTAVIAWYGYDIPVSWPTDQATTLPGNVHDTMAAGSAANAAAGAPLLAADLMSIKAMAQVSARVTVLGFSMGSTIVSEAASYDLPVDSIVLLGSPGAGWDTETAAGYHNIPASNVYVLSYDQDPVTLPMTDVLASRMLGITDPYGPDPAAKSFGANDIDATTNVSGAGVSDSGVFGMLATLSRLTGDPAHHTMKNYMQGKALAAEGSVVVGRRDAVPTKPGR